MGASFANVQVRVPAGVDAVAVARGVLDRLAAAAGLVPTDGEADRGVLLVRSGDWLAVYDEGLEEGEPDALLGALSTALGPAFAVFVHDSDVLLLTLAEGGRVVDRYDSNPEFSTGKGKRGKPGPHVAAWSRVMGVAGDAILPVFTDDSAFAESALGPLAAALGVAREPLGTGFRYLEADGVPESAIRLGYASPDRPAWETPFTGPPRLVTQADEARAMGAVLPAPRPVETAVGAELRLSLTTRNRGGPATGLAVEVEGPPGYACTAVELVLGNPHDRDFRKAVPTGSGGRSVATFPEVSIAAGAPDPGPQDFARLGTKAFSVRLRSQVHVNVVGAARTVGEGVVRVRLVPGGQVDGAASGGFPIGVRDTSDRPLRAAPTVHPTMLAPLAARDLVVALVIGPDAPRLARIPGALADAFPGTPKVRWTVFPRTTRGALPKAPKLKTVKAAGFLAGPWEALAAEVPGATGTLRCDWVAAANTLEAAAHLELGVGMIPPADAVPALAVSIGPEGDRDAAERALAAAIDDLARDGGLVQAFLTRSGMGVSIEMTPYEQACGVMGQCTLARGWVERWLRGLGVGTVWLGPALRALAPDAGTPVGDAVRVDVRDVRAAERALAPILPGTSDWQAGVRALYR